MPLDFCHSIIHQRENYVQYQQPTDISVAFSTQRDKAAVCLSQAHKPEECLCLLWISLCKLKKKKEHKQMLEGFQQKTNLMDSFLYWDSFAPPSHCCISEPKGHRVKSDPGGSVKDWWEIREEPSGRLETSTDWHWKGQKDGLGKKEFTRQEEN